MWTGSEKFQGGEEDICALETLPAPCALTGLCRDTSSVCGWGYQLSTEPPCWWMTLSLPPRVPALPLAAGSPVEQGSALSRFSCIGWSSVTLSRVGHKLAAKQQQPFAVFALYISAEISEINDRLWYFITKYFRRNAPHCHHPIKTFSYLTTYLNLYYYPWHHQLDGVWASSRRWWWTGKPGMLQSMGLKRVGHDWTEQISPYY